MGPHGTSDERFEQAASILEQLLKYTRQLAAFEHDPQVDVGALSEACRQRIEDLKGVLPEGGLSADPRLREMFLELRAQTELCTEALEEELEKTAARIDTMSRTKRAIKAYRP